MNHEIKVTAIYKKNKVDPGLQIRGGAEDNSKIIFLISQQKNML